VPTTRRIASVRRDEIRGRTDRRIGYGLLGSEGSALSTAGVGRLSERRAIAKAHADAPRGSVCCARLCSVFRRNAARLGAEPPPPGRCGSRIHILRDRHFRVDSMKMAPRTDRGSRTVARRPPLPRVDFVDDRPATSRATLAPTRDAGADRERDGEGAQPYDPRLAQTERTGTSVDEHGRVRRGL